MERFLPNLKAIDENDVFTLLLPYEAEIKKSLDLLVRDFKKNHYTKNHFVSLLGGQAIDLETDTLNIPFVDHLDIGNDILRYSAILRQTVKILNLDTVVFATNHPAFMSHSMKSSISVFIQKSDGMNLFFTYHMNTTDDSLSLQQLYSYIATNDGLLDKIKAHSDVDQMCFGGLLNIFDQEFFCRTQLSLSFLQASIKHAFDFVQKIKR